MANKKAFSSDKTTPYDGFIGASVRGKRVLWGVAPTGKIHLGYAGYLYLLRQWRAEGAQIILLLANYHGYFDSEKTSWADITAKTEYYRQTFALYGFSDTMETASFYLKDSYINLIFKFAPFLQIETAKQAGKTTLRAKPDSYSLADMLYIATQIIDAMFLNVDIVVCGPDEAPIYEIGLPLLKTHFNHNCECIVLPMCPGLFENEMHSSDVDENKILLDDAESIVLFKLTSSFVRSGYPEAIGKYVQEVLLPLAGEVSDDFGIELTSRSFNEILARNISIILKKLKK